MTVAPMAADQASAHKSDIEEAQRLLLEEARVLENLANNLDASFSQAVDILLNAKGRVIITGMGKSGHIGAKIAATFASTGTPAFFVHPGEASHGDLGMITQEDAVIGISHSGESRELSDILAYCMRNSVPLISITGRERSTLAKAGTVTLLNGVTEEACPLNLAPTSSTTASLAIGDALAVALMQRRGFKAEDFSQYHPGGKLGSQLLRVEELMKSGKDVPLMPSTGNMQDALMAMAHKNLGCVGIEENGKLAGIITDGDLRRHMSPDLLTKPVTEIMTRNPKVIEADAFATSAVALMQEKSITVLFVVDEENAPKGVLHMHHCLQAGVI